MSDSIVRARDPGESEWFRVLYDQHREALKQYVKRWKRGMPELDGMTSALAMEALWKSHRAYSAGQDSLQSDDASNPVPPRAVWVIARNLIRDLWRSLRRHHHDEASESEIEAAEAGSEHQPLERAIWSEGQSVLDRVLERLPADERDAVLLAIVYKISAPRIAPALGISEREFYSRRNRGLDHLRRLLREEGMDDFASR